MPRGDLRLTEAANQQISMFLLGIKQLGHEVDHSPLSSAKVKNVWSYTSNPSICLHGGAPLLLNGESYLTPSNHT